MSVLTLRCRQRHQRRIHVAGRDLLGLSQRFLTAGGAAQGFATESACPFSILHQMVIVTAFFVVQRDWASGLECAVIAVASFALTLLICEVAVRRWAPLPFLFAMKPRKRRSVRPVVEPAAQWGAPPRAAVIRANRYRNTASGR